MRRAGVVAVAVLVLQAGGGALAQATPEAARSERTQRASERAQERSERARSEMDRRHADAGDEQAQLKRAALHGLALSGTAESRAALARIAKGAGQPELRAEALHALGIAGGEESRALIAEVYAATADSEVKEAALHALMIAHDKPRLFALAKAEQDPELRGQAIRMLGITQAKAELAQLLAAATTADQREPVIEALFLAGDPEALIALARSGDPETRRIAVEKLALMRSPEATKLMLEILEK